MKSLSVKKTYKNSQKCQIDVTGSINAGTYSTISYQLIKNFPQLNFIPQSFNVYISASNNIIYGESDQLETLKSILYQKVADTQEIILNILGTKIYYTINEGHKKVSINLDNCERLSSLDQNNISQYISADLSKYLPNTPDNDDKLYIHIELELTE